MSEESKSLTSLDYMYKLNIWLDLSYKVHSDIDIISILDIRDTRQNTSGGPEGPISFLLHFLLPPLCRAAGVASGGK